MTLNEYLDTNPKGTFSIRCRRVGQKTATKIVEVYRSNHQDVWVWIEKARGKCGETVEARINRRTRIGCQYDADDYVVV